MKTAASETAGRIGALAVGQPLRVSRARHGAAPATVTQSLCCFGRPAACHAVLLRTQTVLSAARLAAAATVEHGRLQPCCCDTALPVAWPEPDLGTTNTLIAVSWFNRAL